jgi:hypothetical protein
MLVSNDFQTLARGPTASIADLQGRFQRSGKKRDLEKKRFHKAPEKGCH